MITNASERPDDGHRSDPVKPGSFSPAVWRAIAVLMGIVLLTQLGGEAIRQLLRYDRAAIEAGQWWRLLTGHFVHLGWYHWFLNELGLVVLVLLCPQALRLSTLAARVSFIGVATSLGLYIFTPDLRYYLGLSGVIHGLFLLGLWPQVIKRDWIGLGCFAYLIAKLGYEQWAGAPVSDEAAIGGSVITDSHFFGALAAVVYALIFRNWRRKDAAIDKDGTRSRDKD